MKTLNIIISAAFLFLLSAGPVSGQSTGQTGMQQDQGTVKATGQAPAGEGIRVEYIIRVHLQEGLMLSGTYEVQLVNSNGAQVAPAQIYRENQSNYKFTERVEPGSGTRIARMVPSGTSEPEMGATELATEPVEENIDFYSNTEYPFDLYPRFTVMGMK